MKYGFQSKFRGIAWNCAQVKSNAYLEFYSLCSRFGTLRGSQVNRSLREKSRVEPQYSNFNRDPFGTMRAARGSSVPSSSASDVFLDPEPGTQDRVPGHQDRVPGHQDRVPGHQDRVPGHQDRLPGHQDREPGIYDRGPENQDRGPGIHDRGPGIHDREPRNQNRTDKNVERVDEPDYRGVGEPVDPQLAATDELLGKHDLFYIHKQLMTFMQSYWYLICLMFF